MIWLTEYSNLPNGDFPADLLFRVNVRERTGQDDFETRQYILYGFKSSSTAMYTKMKYGKAVRDANWLIKREMSYARSNAEYVLRHRQKKAMEAAECSG